MARPLESWKYTRELIDLVGEFNENPEEPIVVRCESLKEAQAWRLELHSYRGTLRKAAAKFAGEQALEREKSGLLPENKLAEQEGDPFDRAEIQLDKEALTLTIVSKDRTKFSMAVTKALEERRLKLEAKCAQRDSEEDGK